jgi:hypothetical protein
VSFYLEFPRLLKFKGERLNNVMPYVGAASISDMILSQKGFDDENLYI